MALAVSSVSPSTVYKRDWNIQLTITGTSFTSAGFAVTFGDTEIEVLQSVYVNSTTGYAYVNIPDTCTSGANTITVTTTAGGSATSGAILTVANQVVPMYKPKPENAEGVFLPFVDNEGKATQVKLNSSGQVPMEANLVVKDIEIGAVELKNATDDTRAVVKTDGTNNALVVMENTKGTGSYNQVSIGNTATLVKAANLSRKMISIHNTSANNCFIGTDGSVTTSNGHLLPGHCSLDLGGYNGAVYAVFVAAGPTTVTYLEV